MITTYKAHQRQKIKSKNDSIPYPPNLETLPSFLPTSYPATRNKQATSNAHTEQ